MASVINTNVMSLNAQRNLSSSQNSLKTSLERLSSGLRINSAKDDAAGLAIADRMTTQIRGMNQAVRNANDAISLAQTGEGALKQVTSNMQRMRELAVQSANETNTASDRESLNAEFQELLAENDRLAETTSFNGRKVLDGTLGNAKFQVGANVGETIEVNVSASMRTNAIGSFATTTNTLNEVNVTGANAAAIATALDDGTANTARLDQAGDLKINGFDVGPAVDGAAGQGDDSAYAIANAINATTDDHGVTATANATSQTVSAADIASFGFTQDDTSVDTLGYTLSINGTQVLNQEDSTADPTTAKTADQLASAINAVQDKTGVNASVNSGGDLILTAADGRNIEITESLTGGGDATDEMTSYFGTNLVQDGTNDAAGKITKGTISLSSDQDISVLSNDDNSQDFFTEFADTETGTTSTSTLDQSNILNVANSEDAIQRIDQAISDVDVFRGTFGAIQSRFESTVASLQTTVENVSAARSRIQDADFASETAQLTRNQILQQASTAMLSQANSAPQGVLSLLQ